MVRMLCQIHFFLVDCVTDFSRPNTYSRSSRHVRGALQDFLDSHRRGNLGTALNGLDFPMPQLNLFPETFATDVAAFNSVLGRFMCNNKTPYPRSSMRWGLAATSGAHHLWHIDCDGFGTVIENKTGFKWWIVGRPKDDANRDFPAISDFMENYEVDEVNNSKMDLEGILLVPGSTL